MTYAEVALRRAVTIVNGGTPTPSAEHWGGEIQWATPVDLGAAGPYIDQTQRTLTEVGLRNGSGRVPAGSVLISTRAPIGYLSINRVPMAFNQGCRGLVPRAGVDVRFITFQLMARRTDLEAAGQGSTFTELSGSALADVRIALPSLEEQRRVADFLDVQVELIDRAITLRQHQVTLLEEQHRALTSAETGSGDRVPLKYLAFFNRQQLPESSEPDLSFRYVDIGCVTSSGEMTIPSEETTFAAAASRARRLAPAGAIVISTVRTYLRAVAQVPAATEDLVFSTGFAVLEARVGVHPGYLYYTCRSEAVIDEVVARSTGVSYPAINASDLAGISVSVPPLQEQKRIADSLDRRADEVANESALLSRSVDLLRERKRSLIAAAVTGQFDVSTASVRAIEVAA